MEGHRSSYIKRTRDFCSKIDGLEHDRVIELPKLLEELSVSNAKSNAILREFFNDDISRISSQIKAIEITVGKIEKAKTISGYSNMENLKKLLSMSNEKKESKQVIEAEIASLKSEKKKLAADLKYIDVRFTELRQSKTFHDLEAHKEKKDDIQKRMKVLESKLSDLLSALVPALKKYSRVSNDEKLIMEYLERPLTAVDNDKDLKIFGIVESMLPLIVSDKLDLREKKKDKALEAISSLDTDSIRQIREESLALRKEKKEIDDILSKDSLMADISDLEYRKSHIEAKIEKAAEQLSAKERLAESMETLDLESKIIEAAAKSGKKLLLTD
jgi:hypothetical protein